MFHFHPSTSHPFSILNNKTVQFFSLTCNLILAWCSMQESQINILLSFCLPPMSHVYTVVVHQATSQHSWLMISACGFCVSGKYIHVYLVVEKHIKNRCNIKGRKIVSLSLVYLRNEKMSAVQELTCNNKQWVSLLISWGKLITLCWHMAKKK